LLIKPRHINTMAAGIGIGTYQQGGFGLAKTLGRIKNNYRGNNQLREMAHGKQNRKPAFFC